MAWLKLSDRWATNPLLLAVRRAPKADDRSVNEVKGFLTSCAASSAAYMTDGRITLDVAEQFGGSRTELLLRQAISAGLLTVSGRGNSRVWTLIDDEDLWNIRSKADIEWEKQRDRDRRSPELTIPVRARDGDQCRYCPAVVNWKDTRTGRGGTFDHVEPGQPATVDTYVVCCKSCNSKLKDKPRPVEGMILRPSPPLPYFSPRSGSQAMVEAYLGHAIRTATDPAREPAAHRDPDTALLRDPDTAIARPLAASSAAEGATTAPPPDQAPTNVVGAWSEGGCPDGTGRDGTGGVWSGAPPGEVPSDSPSARPSSARRRGRRGRRGGGDG